MIDRANPLDAIHDKLESLQHEVGSLRTDLQVAHVRIAEVEEDGRQVIIELNDVKHVAGEEIHALTEKVRGLAVRLICQETENAILNARLTSRDEDVEELTMQVKAMEDLLKVQRGDSELVGPPPTVSPPTMPLPLPPAQVEVPPPIVPEVPPPAQPISPPPVMPEVPLAAQTVSLPPTTPEDPPPTTQEVKESGLLHLAATSAGEVLASASAAGPTMIASEVSAQVPGADMPPPPLPPSVTLQPPTPQTSQEAATYAPTTLLQVPGDPPVAGSPPPQARPRSRSRSPAPPLAELHQSPRLSPRPSPSPAGKSPSQLKRPSNPPEEEPPAKRRK